MPTGDVSEWSMALNINLLAPMALTNAFAPKMQEQKVGLCFCAMQQRTLTGMHSMLAV